MIVKLNEDIETWFYEIKNSKHSHNIFISVSHSILRWIKMTSEIKSDISRKLTVHIASSKILFIFRLDFAFNDDFNLLLKSRDIYNVKAKLRRDDLDSLTSIQVVMRELNRDDDDWFYFFQTDARNQIAHLFFVKETSQNVLKRNYKILMMNYTYKINR
jgi:hypothetical protein